MTMKYNASLDLIAMAVEAYFDGNMDAATKHFHSAVKNPAIKSALMAIEATNAKAHAVLEASKTASKPTKASSRVKASDAALDADNVGEEEREEPKQNKKLREVQEGAALDDFEEDADATAAVKATTEKFKRYLANLHASAE